MTTQACRALVLTGLPLEQNAMAKGLAGVTSSVTADFPLLTGQSANDWTVSVACVGKYNARAGTATSLLISEVRPRMALFVGIAGGIPEKIPDGTVVVVPTKAYHYGPRKEEDGEFFARPELEHPSQRLLAELQVLAHDGAWETAALGTLEPLADAKVEIGPIASGEVLVKDSGATLAFIEQHFNDAVAVEQEGFGFLEAARLSRTPAAIIRAISDRLTDKEESDKAGGQPVAAAAAARLGLALILRQECPELEHATERKTHVTSLPARPLVFIGRSADLDNLIEASSKGEDRPVPIVVSGASGIGKTALMSEAAHSVASSFDVAWWVRCAQPETWSADLLALSEATEGRLSISPDGAVRIDPELSALVAFDDLPDEGNNTIPAAVGGLRVVGTSSKRVWDGVAHMIELERLSTAASVRLLRAAGLEGPNRTLTKVAVRLDGYPLALRQAAGFARAAGITAEELTSLVEDRVGEMTSRGQPSDHPVALTTMFELTLSQLKADDDSAGDLLNVLSTMSPLPLPIDALKGLTEQQLGGSAPLFADGLALFDALTSCGRHSLADVSVGEVELHGLTKQLLIERQNSETKEQAARAATDLLVRASSTEQVDERMLVPHLVAVPEFLDQYTPADLGAVLLREKAAELLRSHGGLSEALAVLEQAAQALDRIERLAEAGDPQAGEVAEMLPGEIVTVTHLTGLVLADLGETSDAISVAESGVAQVKGGSDKDYSVALNNLGLAYHRAGRHTEAIATLSMAIEIDRRVGDSRTLARHLLNLVDSTQDSREPGLRDLCRTTLEEASEIVEAAGLGSEKIRVLEGQAALHEADGNPELALNLRREALEIRREQLPREARAVAIAAFNLALAFEGMGDWGQARPLYEFSLELATEIWPSNDDEVKIRRAHVLGLRVRDGSTESVDELLELYDRATEGRFSASIQLLAARALADSDRPVEAIELLDDSHAASREDALGLGLSRIQVAVRMKHPPALRREVQRLLEISGMGVVKLSLDEADLAIEDVKDAAFASFVVSAVTTAAEVLADHGHSRLATALATSLKETIETRQDWEEVALAADRERIIALLA